MYGVEAFFLWIFLIIIWFVILYFVIKAAVKSALWESRNIREHTEHREVDFTSSEVEYNSDGVHIAKTTCPKCHKMYDMDYPKCPHCGYIA